MKARKFLKIIHSQRVVFHTKSFRDNKEMAKLKPTKDLKVLNLAKHFELVAPIVKNWF